MPPVEKLFDIQRDGERRLGVYTMSGEYEIIYCLLDAESMAPKELQSYSRLAPTAFYQTLKRMEKRGFVEGRINPDDGRGLLYRLSDAMRELVLDQHRGYRDMVTANYSYAEADAHSLGDYRNFIHRTDSVSHLTADFQILLYLYLKSGISNLQISDVVDVSQTKFNQSLRKLREMGLVEFEKDPSDNRSKRYSLTPAMRALMDDQHRRIFNWVDAEGSARGASA